MRHRDFIFIYGTLNLQKEKRFKVTIAMSSNVEAEGGQYRMETGADLISLKQRQSGAGLAEDVWCLEAAWEVANKVGGIYTVLRSKAAVSVQELGDK